ncbi:tRNA pseudouridine(38-40) synthase TruA [bacterium]|jgi:tRNA pseudouridine38-40 synthase|nr:tRNA pseudouridine(38-40) synthase TruA [bacterium]
MKFALRISYLGKNYCGWQRQSPDVSKAPPLPSIQETVEQALSRMIGSPISLVGSGRTDAGVHALGQVAHFRLDSGRFTTEILRKGLNSLLPQDIRVMQAFSVPEEFHAQRSAVKKQYSYYFFQGPGPLPQFMETSWWIRRTLDLQAMCEAIAHLRGEHDFKSFQASGANPGKTTVRRLLEAEVARLPLPDFPGQDLNERGYGMVRMRLVGTGFLKQMVRGIAGTLLQIGEGQRKPSEMKEVLESKSRSAVGPTAPAKGLTLERVWYIPDLYGNPN